MIALSAAVIPCALGKQRTFRGKVIDFHAKQPIEGAVVVACWHEARPAVGAESSRVKDVKETLTDRNGEWTIVGEEGKPYNPNPYWSFLTGSYYTKHPVFIIFKPAYEAYGQGVVSYYAYAYADKEESREGLLVYVTELEEHYRKKYREKEPLRDYFGTPFFPLKEPETRLRNLDIPFEYREDVSRLVPGKSFQFETYTVIGLKKLMTREERLRNLPGPVSGEGTLEKQKEFIRLLNEESANLGLRGRY